MKYKVNRDKSYDFLNQSYKDEYPNLHRYPATMLPQIGSKLLNDFNVKKGNLLDPYCGSGSTFASALGYGIENMCGYDINPLAILISKGKFTKLSKSSIYRESANLRSEIYELMKDRDKINSMSIPKITNIDFWFSKEVVKKLSIILHHVKKIKNKQVQNLFLIPFSETVRDCSFTRNKEFKLYRMKQEDTMLFNPDVLGVFFHKLEKAIEIYVNVYYPLLSKGVSINLHFERFSKKSKNYDIVLTSPPYGDSRTTVAYGQFSTLSNEWLGIENARKIDGALMGGKKDKELYTNGIISDYIELIAQEDRKRALEVSAFYKDLEDSILKVTDSMNKKAKSFYVVGNRTVKGIQLPTDQFIAEIFEQQRCKHITTIERTIGSKAMPSRNSPTNVKGKTINTMLYEYIIVSEKN